MRSEQSMKREVGLLQNVQRPDGTWFPLWFGHQFNEDDENPLYGTSRVVRAMGIIGEERSDCCQEAVRRVLVNQNDGGVWWLLAVWTFLWLAVRVNEGTVDRPTPIDFYFARLWYFEDLYPIISATTGLNRWRTTVNA